MVARPYVARLAALWLTAGLASAWHVYDIPAAVSNRSTTAHFTASAHGLDAPKVQPVNASTFDWWYFDAVSTHPGSRASVTVVFHTSAASAFPFLPPSDTTTLALISGSFLNGTLFSVTISAKGATVMADENVSSGDWHGTGLGWTHSGNGLYTVLVDAPHVGLQGRITFRSIAPAHYPCGPVSAGQTMEVAPGIGWASAIPDAVSTVELTVNGTKLEFKGAGYHDKNWGNQVFTSNVAAWYWGHGRLGPYSIVWFDYLAQDGTEHVSAYAAKDGEIVTASCAALSARVRLSAKNSAFPLPGPSSGYHVTLDLGKTGTLEVNVSVMEKVVDTPVYTRAVGAISGEVVPIGGYSEGEGKKVLQGKALIDQFQLFK